MNVLILDDDRHFRAILAEVLISRGHRVLQARNGHDATEIVGREEIDLVVVDGLLPDTNGINWIAGLRAAGSSARVVFVSAFWRDLQSFHRLTDELGVSLVVHKPVVPTGLAEQIERQVDQRQPMPSAPPSEQDFKAAMTAMAASFAAGLPIKVRRLGQALRRVRNHPGSPFLVNEARVLAHKLRGTAGTYGFAAVSEAAAKVEEALLALAQVSVEEHAGLWAQIDTALDAGLAAAVTAEQEVRDRARVVSRAIIRMPTSRVLVATDDEAFLTFAGDVGRQHLLEVVPADTAHAVESARAAPPDAAVIDISLGRAEQAFALARTLRTVPGCATLPLAFVSSSGEIQNRVAATHAGASVYLVKPLSPEGFGAAIRELVATRQSEHPKVMVLDDDPAFNAQLTLALTNDGMVVQALENPATILEGLETHRPDALILDLLLPGTNGLEICRILRTTPRWQELPILMVTGATEAESRIAAFSAGADDYLTKPLLIEELRSRIQVRVDRSRLRRERLERDVLTGLLLRRAFLDGLVARLREASRHRRALSLCLIDLDHFKNINDQHGHLAGDRVLTGLGGLLSSRFRTEDLRGRWGGEEFVLAFPGERTDTIAPVVNRVLEEFRGLTFAGDKGESFSTSFSAGIAALPEDGLSVEALLQTADRRLYAAKAAGRCRTVMEG